MSRNAPPTAYQHPNSDRITSSAKGSSRQGLHDIQACQAVLWNSLSLDDQKKMVQKMVVERLNSYCHLHINNNNSSYNRLLRIFDTSFDGSVTAAEFKRGLARMELHLNDDQVRMLMKSFDPHNAGRFYLHEFARALQDGRLYDPQEVTAAPAPELRKRYNDALRRTVRLKLEEKNTSMHSAFLKMDKNRQGYLTYDELKDGLHANKVGLTEEDLDDICEVCDTEQVGRITCDQFVKYLGRADYTTDSIPAKNIRKIHNYDIDSVGERAKYPLRCSNSYNRTPQCRVGPMAEDDMSIHSQQSGRR